MLEYGSTIGDAEQWPPSCASRGDNLARPFIATVDQIDDSSYPTEYGVPHLSLGYEAESVSCRISNLLQSLEPQLPRLDSIMYHLIDSVWLKLRLSIFFRGCIPNAIILHQARISRTTIYPVHRKPTAEAAEFQSVPYFMTPREQLAVLNLNISPNLMSAM